MSARAPVLAAVIILAWGVACRPALGQDKPPEIPSVNTLENLRGLKAVRVGEWDVRVGIADGGADSGPWQLVYCHAMYLGADDRPGLGGGAGGGGDILGPVYVRAAYEPQQHAVQKMKWLSGPLPKEALFCQAVPLLRKGRCVVDVVGPREEVLFQRNLTVEEPRPCHWQIFARPSREEGRSTPLLEDDPAAARPRYSGMTSLLPGEVAEPDLKLAGAKGDLNRLPSAIPPDPRWKALGGLELLSGEGRFIVRGPGPKLYPRPERHLLARWWVNDKPVVPPRRENVKLQQQAEQVVHAKEMSVPTGLPAHLGELNAGDRVGLQLLYAPNGFDLLPRDPNQIMVQHSIAAGGDGAVVPLLSNRIEIVVTEELLRARMPK